MSDLTTETARAIGEGRLDDAPVETCDVQVAGPTYQIARCGNTAAYKLVNGTNRVCGFHFDGAVRLIPTSKDAFEPLESPREAYERSRFEAAFRGPRGPL